MTPDMPRAACPRPNWQVGAAVAWCALVGWLAFGAERRVPLLSLADLGFHELGHLVMYVFPISDFLTALMGSLLQAAVPLSVGAYFLGRRDHLAAAVCWAWAATSLQNVSTYVADAPYEALELIGGEHDWAYLLGPEQLDRLGDAAGIASAVRGVGVVVLVAAFVLCWVSALPPRRGTSPRMQRRDASAGFSS